MSLAGAQPRSPTNVPACPPSQPADSMQLDGDDARYKVYIYDMDDELAADAGTAGDGDSTLVFLPDIAKHLRDAARTTALTGCAPGSVAAAAAAAGPIKASGTAPPPSVPRPLPLPQDDAPAGMQLVLYSDPSSLSVPREGDSVRQVILDARARLRARQQEERAVEERLAEERLAEERAVDDDSECMEID